MSTVPPRGPLCLEKDSVLGVVVSVANGKGLMAHVGDLRLYMVRAGQIHQLTEDHSYTAEMIKRGKMTREQARQSPYANVITRAVGIQKNVQVDTLLFDIIPGDTCVLMTWAAPETDPCAPVTHYRIAVSGVPGTGRRVGGGG